MYAILVDDEEDIRDAFSQALELEGFTVKTFARANRLMDRVDPDFEGIVISDIRMPQMDGLELQRALAKVDVEIPIILITGNADIDMAVEAMKSGCYDFLTKPVSMPRLCEIAKRAWERRQLVLENRRLRLVTDQRESGELNMIGDSPEIQRLREQIRSIAPLDLPVLIEGETGTGKDFVAQILHQNSPRAEKPFVVVPLAALPRQNIESELFGHVAGAFTGATRDRIGRLEHGRGGTVLLDEIGTLPIDLQAKLLRVIEDNAITPIGSNDPIRLNVRFLASSKENLERRVKEGHFRDDLYYRLNAVRLEIPPLRERKADIPALFYAFVTSSAERLGVEAPSITPEDYMRLAPDNWPGNLRQLRFVAESFVYGLNAYADTEYSENLTDLMATYEKNLIASRLSAFGGNLKETYESLGLSRKSLYEKLLKYGIKRD